MIYLLLAIISSALVSLSIRASEKYITNKYGMLMINYLICSVFSIFYMKRGIAYFSETGTGFMVVLGVISGILYLGTLLMMQYSTKHNGVVLSSTFMKLGVLIPTLMAIIIFREFPKVTQVLGIVLGVPNYFSAKFLLLALGKLKAVLVYPTFSAATLIVISVVGMLVFKEHVDRKKGIALLLIVLALILLNI